MVRSFVDCIKCYVDHIYTMKAGLSAGSDLTVSCGRCALTTAAAPSTLASCSWSPTRSGTTSPSLRSPSASLSASCSPASSLALRSAKSRQGSVLHLLDPLHATLQRSNILGEGLEGQNPAKWPPALVLRAVEVCFHCFSHSCRTQKAPALLILSDAYGRCTRIFTCPVEQKAESRVFYHLSQGGYGRAKTLRSKHPACTMAQMTSGAESGHGLVLQGSS